LIVDVNGYFTGATSALAETGLFVPLDPVRVLDTRKLPIGRLWPQWVVECKVPGTAATTASAVIVNVTGVATRAPGYLTVSPARLPIPGTSNVNWTSAGTNVPNHVITPITATHGFQVFSSSGGHVLADLAGYFTGTQQIAQLAPYTNPPPPAAPPSWTLRIPRMGLTSLVLDGDPKYVTDRGHSWHWTGTGWMGQSAHVVAFAHRTEHGGPYRYLNWLQVGDTWTVTTGDGREFLYRMVRRELTNSVTANILQATRNHPGTTFSLVACSKSNFLPTSLSYRIVVTGELVSWREV
jgi:sortase (surface protein transpeptidase)